MERKFCLLFIVYKYYLIYSDINKENSKRVDTYWIFMKKLRKGYNY